MRYKIVILILLLSLVPVTAEGEYQRTCSDASVASAECASSCDGVGIPCDDGFCGGSCGGQECCCSLGQNTKEIPIGRLMDKTEWLADQIIKHTEREIEATENEILSAQHLYYLSGQCNKERCSGTCSQQSTCAGCECGGCEGQGMISVPGDPSCTEGSGNESQCCDPLPPGGTSWLNTYKTVGLLAVNDSDCTPGAPTGLSATVDKSSATFFWSPGEHKCDELCSTTGCLEQPEFKIEYSVDGGPSSFTSWILDTSRTLSLEEYGEYTWSIHQRSDGTHSSESNEVSFTLQSPGVPNPPENLNAYPYYNFPCRIYLSWETSCDEWDQICKETSEYMVEYTGPESSQFEWSKETRKSLSLSAGGTYEWRVKQRDDFGESEWATGSFVVSSDPAPPPPNITNVTTTQSSLTVNWYSNPDSGCGACACAECSTVSEYKARIESTDATDDITGGGHIMETDWMRDTSYTFTGLYSGASYNVEVTRRNGCGTSSAWWTAQVGTTLCGGAGCQTIQVCEDGVSAAPAECTSLSNSTCVPQGECQDYNGYSMDGGYCLPQCGDGEECCALSSICVASEQQCNLLDGTICEEDCDEFCFGRCEQLGDGALCCTGISQGASGTSGSKIQCDTYSPTVCCTAAYSLCVPTGCTGTPCPEGIQSALADIEGYLASVVAAREQIEFYYQRMTDELAPELQDVRTKMGECFVEDNIGEAILRQEQGVQEMVDCETLVREVQAMSSNLPDKLGNPQSYTEQFCYGYSYCDMMYKQGRAGELPYDHPCAEDFYCCTWE